MYNHRTSPYGLQNRPRNRVYPRESGIDTPMDNHRTSPYDPQSRPQNKVYPRESGIDTPIDNHRTSPYDPQSRPQNRVESQREYREKEKLAFHNLQAALKEAELAKPRSRCDTLSKGEEQINLEQQLEVLTNNRAGANMPQSQAQEYYMSDEELEDWLTQLEYSDYQAMAAGGPPNRGWI
ncbi:hypothetical protein K503DRAFT_782504 [Rhizopogon vinicolor AM-OR11-026]|uniref:Uncharacterized protein n=1 Tax=Rhizopogon vinicolor AM-OR11-026 TaxID=1314800 RepID=A0A1B7N286_9AGAM|nr:hypothetical protein K503DRAFT_782504 [Rhizopogon vinicolor AM-OR11-026]